MSRSVTINYTINTIVSYGSTQVTVGYTLSETVSGLSETHSEVYAADDLDMSVSSTMDSSTKITQMLVNFQNLALPTIRLFAARAGNAIEQAELAALLPTQTGVSAQSVRPLPVSGHVDITLG